jgi:hypothetical protein
MSDKQTEPDFASILDAAEQLYRFDFSRWCGCRCKCIGNSSDNGGGDVKEATAGVAEDGDLKAGSAKRDDAGSVDLN